MPPKRMTANPIRPARYRAGKPTGNESSSSDSDNASDDENEEDDAAAAVTAAIPPPPKASSAKKIVSNVGKVDLDARRKAEEAAEARRIAIKEEERRAAEEGFVTEEEEEEEEEDESGSEEDDDEEEEESSSSSEEEAPRRLMMRPKFIPKNQRAAANTKDGEKDEEAIRQAGEEARKKAADELVEEQIKKDLAARAAGKKHWDDVENEESDVDTTDGLDPEAEEAAWRVRELKRLKRARTAIEEREKELAEVERRRNLTEEERKAEDEDFIARQKEEKEGKGKMAYMQKYFHKGAFFRDETEAAGLLQRDIMGSRIQDDVQNREALPEYLQKRDMAKLGRKGATKYKDMRTEDTGRWGSFDNRRRDSGSERRYDGDDDRFRPDEKGAKGANAIPLGERKEGRDDNRRDLHRDMHRRDRDDHHHRPREDERRRDGEWRDRYSSSRGEDRRGYSRSGSPRRDRDRDRDDYTSRRKRSTSREERYDSDKRRRVDASR